MGYVIAAIIIVVASLAYVSFKAINFDVDA